MLICSFLMYIGVLAALCGLAFTPLWFQEVFFLLSLPLGIGLIEAFISVAHWEDRLDRERHMARKEANNE
jgi:hypothetical protein